VHGPPLAATEDGNDGSLMLPSVGDSHRRLQMVRAAIIARENAILARIQKRESFGWAVYPPSGRLMIFAVLSVTSKLPHSIMRSNRVYLSRTKCSAIYKFLSLALSFSSQHCSNAHLQEPLLLQIRNNSLAQQS
jgi:hypothetical protein